LVNDAFGDPALYVDLMYQRGALLFDLGELGALPPRKILRITHCFVSHAHMDHFAGLDRLVRLFLARPGRLHLYGPPQFVARVEHRLAGYTWNLVHNYDTDFTIVATEADADGRALSAEFHARHGFARSSERRFTCEDFVLVQHPSFRVRYTMLDHKIPSLAYVAEEARHVNVLKTRLEDRGLVVGAWLNTLKRLVLEGAPPETPVAVLQPDGPHERPLAALMDVVHVVPGQRLAYVTDCAGHEANAARIVALADRADTLYIEAPFLAEDEEDARRKAHLTARDAGRLARRAGVRKVVPFHFSSRYEGNAEALRAQVAAAFAGEL
jgi:ribonuclease Z